MLGWVVDGCPSVHRHWVGAVEKMRFRRRDLANILAEVEHHRDRPLPVKDAAGANRIAHARVDAILQGNADIVSEGREAPTREQLIT